MGTFEALAASSARITIDKVPCIYRGVKAVRCFKKGRAAESFRIGLEWDS